MREALKAAEMAAAVSAYTAAAVRKNVTVASRGGGGIGGWGVELGGGGAVVVVKRGNRKTKPLNSLPVLSLASASSKPPAPAATLSSQSTEPEAAPPATLSKYFLPLCLFVYLSIHLSI